MKFHDLLELEFKRTGLSNREIARRIAKQRLEASPDGPEPSVESLRIQIIRYRGGKHLPLEPMRHELAKAFGRTDDFFVSLAGDLAFMAQKFAQQSRDTVALR